MTWTPEQIEPLGDRIFVELIREEEMRGGIIVPQNAQGHPDRATVLAVGPGARNQKTGEIIPMDFEVGDEVIFNRHAGTAIGGFDYDNYVIFREQDIVARVRPEA